VNSGIMIIIGILFAVLMILAMVYVVQTSEIIKNTPCEPCLQIWGWLNEN